MPFANYSTRGTVRGAAGDHAGESGHHVDQRR